MFDYPISAIQNFPMYRTVKTDDVDEQSALLRNWNQTYDQMSRGRFSGQFTEMEIDDLHIFREVTSTALYQSGSLRDDLFAIGVPVDLQGPATFCGQPCANSTLHLFSGRNGFEFSSPSALDMIGVVLPRQPFLASLQEEERDQVARAFDSAGLLSVSAGKVRHFRELVLRLFDRPNAASALREDLHDLLTDAALPSDRPETPAKPRRVRLVRDARDLATGDRAEGPMSMEELCAELDVSRRTLQYCFNEVMGMAPATYLRYVRLNGARRSIKEAVSVTEAATSWGFWHFGRFAQDYRALFGEQPSATLKRAAARN